MNKQFFTKDGVIVRELTEVEVEAFAKRGDSDAQKELFKKQLELAVNANEKIDAVCDYLLGYPMKVARSAYKVYSRTDFMDMTKTQQVELLKKAGVSVFPSTELERVNLLMQLQNEGKL